MQAAFERRDVLRNIHLLASAKVTGIDVVRYFGFGNETRITEDDDFYRVEAHELSLGLAAEVSSRPELVFTVGPLLSLGTTDTAGTETLVGTDQPYGSGQFHFVGIQSRFDYAGLRSVRDGLRLRTSLEALAAPGWMDVDRGGFTRVSGEGRLLWGFGSTRRLVLATRVGGAVLSGSVPFRLSARIGGPLTLRGYDTDRFSGDRAAAYGAVEARVRVLRFHINFISERSRRPRLHRRRPGVEEGRIVVGNSHRLRRWSLGGTNARMAAGNRRSGRAARRGAQQRAHDRLGGNRLPLLARLPLWARRSATWTLASCTKWGLPARSARLHVWKSLYPSLRPDSRASQGRPPRRSRRTASAR